MSAEDYKPCLCFIQQGTLTMVCQRERHHVGKHHWASPGARCDWPYSQEDCDSVIGSLHQTTEALAASEAARQQAEQDRDDYKRHVESRDSQLAVVLDTVKHPSPRNRQHPSINEYRDRVAELLKAEAEVSDLRAQLQQIQQAIYPDPPSDWEGNATYYAALASAQRTDSGMADAAYDKLDAAETTIADLRAQIARLTSALHLTRTRDEHVAACKVGRERGCVLCLRYDSDVAHARLELIPKVGAARVPPPQEAAQ